MQAAGSTALVPTTDQIVVIQLHCSLFLLVSPSLGSLHDTQFILALARSFSVRESRTSAESNRAGSSLVRLPPNRAIERAEEGN